LPPLKVSAQLSSAIKSLSKESSNSYGKHRMQVELNALSYAIGLHKTASLMEKLI
jgi:hypothetical protein